MKDNTASVLRAGQSLGALFAETGKMIESKKKEIKTKEILDSFKDPNKIFLKPDGTLANPLEVQQKYNQGFNELMSIGSLNEAKGLASQFGDSYKIIANEQANQFSQDAIIVNNPQAKDAFKNTNLSWAGNDAIKFASKDTVAPKYYAGKEIQVEDWYNPETGEIVPGWSSITYISSSDGKYKPIRNGVGYNPKKSETSSYSKSNNSTYSFNGTPDSYMAPSGKLIMVSPNGDAIYVGSKQKVTDPNELSNMRKVDARTADEIKAGIDNKIADTEKKNKADEPVTITDVGKKVPEKNRNAFYRLWSNGLKVADIDLMIATDSDKFEEDYPGLDADSWNNIKGFYQALEKQYGR